MLKISPIKIDPFMQGIEASDSPTGLSLQNGRDYTRKQLVNKIKRYSLLKEGNVSFYCGIRPRR